MKAVIGATALMAISIVLAAAQTNDGNPSGNSLTACLYFLGFHSLPFELPVNDVRQTASRVCKEQIERYNAAMNPPNAPAKLAYGQEKGLKAKQTDYAKIIIDSFLADYAKQLTIVKRR